MKRFEKLTQLIPELESAKTYGSWIVDNEHEGTYDDPKVFPYVDYDIIVFRLTNMVYECYEDNKDLDVRDYRGVLDSYNLAEAGGMLAVDPSTCDARCTFAMILTIVRGDRFSEGLLLEYLENEKILQWVKRLREIDDAG